MAQTISCDFEGCTADDGLPTPANWLVSRQDQGETLAWCDLHYLELCRALVATVDGELEPQPEPATAQGDDDEDEDEDEATLARIAAVRASMPVDDEAAAAAIVASAGSDSPQAPSVPPGPAGEPVGQSRGAPTAPTQPVAGPTVVRRGQSASRRKHEAKQRAKARAAAEKEGNA